MSILLAGVATYTVLLVLLVAAVEHLSRPSALVAALTAHRVLPAPILLAGIVITAEVLLAGAGIVAVADTDLQPLLTAVLAASAGLFTGYAGYGWHLIATGRVVPCGCSRIETPMNGQVVARALVLAASALVGLLLPGEVVRLDRADDRLTVVLLAAATFAALLWHLPAAMDQPAGVTATEGEPPR